MANTKLNSSLTAMDWLPQLSVGGALTTGNPTNINQPTQQPLKTTQRVPFGQFDVTAKYDGTSERFGKSKPPYSYANLIAFSINSNPKNKMTLSEIYLWISETFPYYNETSNGWKNSIRHNLSLNKCFIKLPRTKDDPGKGSYWAIDMSTTNSSEESYKQLSNQTKLRTKNERQLSPYGSNRAGHSPGRVSPVISPIVSPSSPQKLNNSFESNSSSSDYSNPNSVVSSHDTPHIYVNNHSAINLPPQTKPATNNHSTSAKSIDSRQCALDNKSFAEHFNLDDLSASFRSLYKTVFNQSSSSNSSGGMNMSSVPIIKPKENNILTAQSLQQSTGSNHLSHSGQLAPVSIAEPSNSMSEKEVLNTMEALMSSMNSGDWSSIMPDQFYSLIDSLQEMDGLDQKDIDSLEESYTNYLKLQGTFDYLDNDDVELKPELLQPSHNSVQQANFNQLQNQRRASPHSSPYTSPLPPANLQPNQSLLGRISPAGGNSPMANLMDSADLNQVLQPMYGNSMNAMNPNMLVKSTSSNGSIGTNNMVMNSNLNQMNSRFNMSPTGGSPLNHFNHSPVPSPQPPPSYSPQPQYTNQGSPALQMNHTNEMNRGIMQGSPQPPIYQQQQPIPPPQRQTQNQPRKLYQHVEDEEEFDWSSII